MSTKDPNLKVIFGADTKDFDKGAKAVKQGLSDLDKSTGTMLSSLSNAFGVSSGKVEQMTSAIRGLGYRLVETGNSGAQAIGSILAKIGPLTAGIAGLGLGAAIAGFKQLKAEADNFKSTIDGMNMSMATSAYISTYKQVLHDVNSDTGRAVAEAMNNWEKGFGRFKAQLGATFSTFMTSSTLGEFAGSFKELRQAFKEADEAATRNAERASQIADIRKQELQVRKDIADIDVEIAEQRRIIRDRSKSAEERSAAEEAVRSKISERSRMQKEMAESLYVLQSQITSEAGSTYDEMKEVTDLYVQWKGISAAEADQMAGIDRYANSIAGNTSKAAEAAQKQREELEKISAIRSKWSSLAGADLSGLSSIQGSVAGPSLSILPRQEDAEIFKETFLAQLGDFKVAIGFKADTESIQNITNEVTSLLESTVTRTSEIIGNLAGTLANGGNAWGDFKNAALSAFGDMAIAIGKIAIKAGMAAAGISVALKNPQNWFLAVAAGAALVALGSAVKSSLSSVASGDYSASGGGGYSGGYSSGTSNDWEAREVKVEVTGELVANGDQLQIAINNANKKRYITG
jgi:hypothetical protein